MNEKEVIEILLKSRNSLAVYKYLSVINLCDIMMFFEKEFKTKKGNWSIKLYNDFLKEKLKNESFDLENFYKEYSKRKKEVLKFLTFIKLIKRNEYKKRNEWRHNTNKKIHLRNKDKIKDFLKELQLVKHRYLDCSDAKLIKLISEEFETGYSESTLRKYFYSQK